MKISNLVRGAILTPFFASPALAADECRGPSASPDLSIKEMADVLSNKAISDWPELGQYSDEYLVDVARWMKSAVGLRDLTREVEATIETEILEKIKSGQTVNWDAVIEGSGFGAHAVIASLQEAGPSLTSGMIEEAIDLAKDGIYDFGKEAFNRINEIVKDVPYCSAVAGADEPALRV